ncbi:MAG: leucine--tRNA ligase [Candidatus Kapabacteria bacterium]|nr:leucine--tRNA ligase [Candidatus Kapabacteria bacterium]
MASYPFKELEPKWQKFWEENNVYSIEDDYDKPKYYILDMFPYPSGAGLHIGHPEGYTATDIVARYKKMKGFNVLHPIGFDSFGLPTERYSMTTGIPPQKATDDNVANFTRQLKFIGFNYDWSKAIRTSDSTYYKWTQWMFLMIYNSWYDHDLKKAKHINELQIPSELKSKTEIDEYIDSKRMAFVAEMPVNWCDALGTVLANEEVDEWKDKGYTVERRPMRQWMLKITEYADRLLEDLDLVDWPQSTMDMQKHWIGKSEGAEIYFGIENSDKKIKVYTTRPDTIFGATYLVLAPEHPLVSEIATLSQVDKLVKYIKETTLKSDMERGEMSKSKTGVFTGAYAINPANSAKIPILIADYVLGSYGTGAIMAVPGHDERDHEFAKLLDMKIVQVVAPKDGSEWDVQKSAYTEYGISVNSESCDFAIEGMKSEDAKKATIEWLEKTGLGNRKIQFRLREWLFSRQRYWGEPIPIIFFPDGTKRSMDIDELPLALPHVDNYKQAEGGESPLANVPEWVNYLDQKTGKTGKIETNTMPQWAGSCWYYLRYIDPFNNDVFCDSQKEKYWMGDKGVDLYVGGTEHAVLHLLYARFWHKVLYDFGYVNSKEPFHKLFHQGLIMGEDGRKMSKSLGNVVNPDDVVNEFGADSLRLFEMFLGPLESSKPWSTNGIEGVNRFLSRVWRLIADEEGKLLDAVQEIELNKDMEYVLHSTIKKVSEDIENLSFNTAISQMMIFVNEFTKYDVRPISAMKEFLKCLAPFAPHISEELWEILGEKETIVRADFPIYDEAKTIKQEIEFVVQVASKIRARLNLPLDVSQEDAEKLARENETIVKYLEGQTVKKVIFVKNKLINFIV